MPIENNPHRASSSALAHLDWLLDQAPIRHFLRAMLSRSISSVNHTIVRHEFSIPALSSLAIGGRARGLHRNTDACPPRPRRCEANNCCTTPKVRAGSSPPPAVSLRPNEARGRNGDSSWRHATCGTGESGERAPRKSPANFTHDGQTSPSSSNCCGRMQISWGRRRLNGSRWRSCPQHQERT